MVAWQRLHLCLWWKQLAATDRQILIGRLQLQRDQTSAKIIAHRKHLTLSLSFSVSLSLTGRLPDLQNRDFFIATLATALTFRAGGKSNPPI